MLISLCRILPGRVPSSEFGATGPLRNELAAELGDDSEEAVTQARARGQLVK